MCTLIIYHTLHKKAIKIQVCLKKGKKCFYLYNCLIRIHFKEKNMKIVSETNIMGRWEIIVQTTNQQDQEIAKEELNKLNVEFIESGVNEIIVYANETQKIQMDDLFYNL